MLCRALILLVAMVCLILGAVPAGADRVVLLDGSEYRETEFLTFGPDAQGNGIFQARLLNNGQWTGPHPLEPARINTIQFGLPEGLLGIEATMTLSNGSQFPGVTVLSATNGLDGLTLMVRNAGEGAETPGHPVLLSRIASLQFQRPAAEEATPTPSPTAEDDPFAAAAAEADTGAPDAAGGAAANGPDVADVAGDVDDWEDEEEEEVPLSSLMGALGLGLVGAIAAVVISYMISILIGFAGIYLACLMVADKQPPAKRMLLCAVYLPIFSFLTLFLLCIPIPCLNLIIALVVWFLGSRAIIQGTLEVGEDTALAIFILYVIGGVVLHFTVDSMGASSPISF